MSLTRRQLLKMMGGAGLSLPIGERFFPLLSAYAARRPGSRDIRGPGQSSYSRSVCRDCANHCSLTLRQVDGLPVGLRGTTWHPASRGGLCLSGQSQLQALFDPDRLRSPLRRVDAGEPGTAVGWNEGLDALAEQIGSLLARGAGDRLVVVDGRSPSLGTALVAAWTRSIPGARYVPFRIEHALDRMLARFLGGGRGGRLRLDLERCGTLLLVGHELLEVDGSPVSQMRAHGERGEGSRTSGAPTIYLGPRQGATAVKADLWIPCFPGQERDILLGLAEALSRTHPRRDALMREYARWIPEAADPVEFARHYSLENVAQRVSLDLEMLLALRRALFESSPAVCLGGASLLRRQTGGPDLRAALALNLWTGGFQSEGGLSWGTDPVHEAAATLGFAGTEDDDPGTLAELFRPLLKIKRSPVDVLVCIEANLAHELSGQDQIGRALTHVPFLACLTPYEDETSRLAHVTLPTLFDLESWDLPAPAWGLPQAAVQVQQPALDPVVDGRTAEDIVLALAAAGAAGPGFRAPAADSAGLVAAGVGALVAGGTGQLIDDEGERSVASLGAAAAQRKLLAGEAAWLGEHSTGPAATRQPDLEYPPSVPNVDLAPGQVWLQPFDGAGLQGGRILNRPMMMELAGLWHGIAWEPWGEINPTDAKRAGVVSGDRIMIRGPRAEIVVKVVVTYAMAAGVVAVPVGFGHWALGEVARGQGASPLALPHARFDDETGAPVWGPIPVFLKKA